MKKKMFVSPHLHKLSFPILQLSFLIAKEATEEQFIHLTSAQKLKIKT